MGRCKPAGVEAGNHGTGKAGDHLPGDDHKENQAGCGVRRLVAQSSVSEFKSRPVSYEYEMARRGGLSAI